MTKKIKLGFIGGGNMGQALMEAVVKKKLINASAMGLYEPDVERCRLLRRKLGLQLFKSNTELTKASEILLLAVKPQQMSSVLDEIRPHLEKNMLIVSIAAGLDTEFFEKRLPKKTRLIRAMPNMCAMIGEGASALYAAPAATRADQALALKIFSAAGQAVFVGSEKLLDAVTAVSGSGPAFVYLFMDALIEAGEKQGLPREMTKKLVVQTLVGAAHMVEGSHETIQTMISRVASKGGTTEAGLQVLSDKNFRDIIRDTIAAAAKRARELRCTS